MINKVLGNFWRFVLLIAIQVLLLNQLRLQSMFSPYIYPLFILLLPIDLPRPWLLFLALLTGLTVDAFSNSMGMHASASLLVGWLRTPVLNLLKPSGGYQVEDRPTINFMGFRWFLFYSGILMFIHHFYFFFIETFSLGHFFFMMTRIFLSFIFSIILILIYEYLTYQKKT